MKNVVIGGDLFSLRYAFQHNLPLFYIEPKKPHRFTGDVEEWHHLYWCLSLSGNIKFSNSISSIVIDTDACSMRVIYNNRAKTFENIETFYIFDEQGVTGLPVPVKMSSNENEVLDWISVRSGMKHDFDRIENTSPFMECILFYPTERIAGNHSLKDVCVRSILTTDEINQFEYSELVVKVKTEEMMKAAGIKGAGNGVGKFLSIKLESHRREVYPMGVPVYENHSPSLVFRPADSVSYPESQGSYLNYLMTELAGA